jgi:hypothetical protein
MRQLMQKLRQMFQKDWTLQQPVEQMLDRVYGERPGRRNIRKVLAALYAGPDHYYITFYGPLGTMRTMPYEALQTGRREKTRQDRGI